ncbi:transcriptional regulator [Neobacillus bataviensis LMG 21833]|uniref:Transcriptional regulator n=1 Tax=Neobacillus bataviensis LMG 21833 TaxID=1117379 RepID=K6E0F9_9BACI|nr:LysR family transcriptional regulator [Neobacillus bataviensis]EKN66641.1 transcriptional regulator [Neobacillus bataviensis LMG 21833]
MNIEQLKYIVEVAKTRSITTAAQNLHVTQSGISRAIASLEDELGIYLSKRTRLGAELTVDGKELISQAKEILLKLQEFEEKARNKQTELKISAIFGLCNTILLDAFKSFQEKQCHIKVDIEEDSTEGIIEGVKEGKTHAGLIHIYESMLKEHDDLLFKILFDSKVYVLVNKHSPLASREYITPYDLSEHPIVIYNSVYVRAFFQELSDKYASNKILFATNNTDIIEKTVAEGRAISFILVNDIKNEKVMLNNMIISKPFLIDNYPVKIPMGYVVTKNNSSKSAKIFLNIIQDQMENYKI